MAKRDYTKDAGMWGVQPTATGPTPDAILDSLVPHFEKIWDGHSKPSRRACNVLMTYGNTNTWGYLPGENRAKRNAYAYGEWLLRVKEANSSSSGAGAPRYLTGIVFRGMWNLTYVPSEPHWSPSEIGEMVNHFLGYFGNTDDPLPENKGDHLNRDDLALLRGYLLGDDFAKQPYNSQWDQIIQEVHAIQQTYSANRPFYFSNQIFDTRIWGWPSSYGNRLENLKQWLNIFNSTGATPIFIPQFYPWEGGGWAYHDERDPYVWWNIALDELLYLKNNGYPSLRVQPIIQAYAGANAGPGHPDIHNQLRTVLNHGVVEAVWLLNWNFIGNYAWTCYKTGDDRWTDKQHIAEAIQVEAGGEPEVVIKSVPSSGMIEAEPANFYRQSGRNKGPGGTRLKFNLNAQEKIRIAIKGDIERSLLDGFTLGDRHYSFDGPWNKAQYTRDPKLSPDDTSLNPLHGTSINWNGWKEQDTEQTPPGEYTIRLQKATGARMGRTIIVVAS